MVALGEGAVSYVRGTPVHASERHCVGGAGRVWAALACLWVNTRSRAERQVHSSRIETNLAAMYFLVWTPRETRTYRVTWLIRKHRPPQDHHTALGMSERYSPRERGSRPGSRPGRLRTGQALVCSSLLVPSHV